MLLRVEGNGLTPFAEHIDTTEQLLKLVKAHVMPPKHDLRGLNGSNDVEGTNAYVE